jgi:cysteinyl-tRNA synthetase
MARTAVDGQHLDAQRLPAGRRPEDVEEPRQLHHHQRVTGVGLFAAWKYPSTEIELSASNELESEFLKALADDLNTARAIGLLLEGATDLKAGKLEELLNLLGISMLAVSASEEVRNQLSKDVVDQVCRLVTARLEARKAKNWAESDRIRDELAAMGIAIKDNKDGTTSWEVKR